MTNNPDEVTQELRDLYDKVYDDGFFIKEFDKLTGVGDLRDLEYIANANGIDLDVAVDKLTMGYTVDLTTPGRGVTRIEQLQTAWQDAKKMRDKNELPRMVAVREKLGLPSTPKPLGTF